MNKLSLPDQISLLVQPLLASLGLCLWGLEYFPSTSRAILRIYIEKEGYADKNAAPVIEYTDSPSEDEEYAADNTDNENGESVGIDECTEVSRLIGLTLEVEDLIPSAYVLEVSTPGLDRRFFQPEQLAAYVGERVEINLHEAVPGHGLRRKFAGRLLSACPHEAGMDATDPAAATLAAENYCFTLDFSDNDASAVPKELTLYEVLTTVDKSDTYLGFAWADVKKAKLLYEPPPKVKPGHKNRPAKREKA